MVQADNLIPFHFFMMVPVVSAFRSLCDNDMFHPVQGHPWPILLNAFFHVRLPPNLVQRLLRLHFPILLDVDILICFESMGSIGREFDTSKLSGTQWSD